MYEKSDPVYLEVAQYNNPKASFLEIISNLVNRFGQQPVSILDFGCSNGSFLYHAIRYLNISRSVGVDLSEELINFAKKNMVDVEFYVSEINNSADLNLGHFDICSCLGSFCLFDEIDRPLEAMINHLTNNGVGVLYDLVNPYPVDVWMRYKEQDGTIWKPAYNVRGEETWRESIKKLDSSMRVDILPFRMPYAIEKRSNYMRAWTEKTENNDYQIMSGTRQLLDFSIIFFQKESK